MVEFLSPQWIAELDRAAREQAVPADLRVVVQQVVVDGDAEVAYAVRVGDGAMSVEPGRARDADVTFTQDRATAAAIATGALSAQAAFIDGRLRVGGDLHALVSRAGELARIDDVFATARAATTWS